MAKIIGSTTATPIDIPVVEKNINTITTKNGKHIIDNNSNDAFMAGVDNNLKNGNNSVIFGHENDVDGESNIVSGSHNIVKGMHNLVIGNKLNVTDNGTAQAVFGLGENVPVKKDVAIAYYNKGKKTFEVLKDGTLTLNDQKVTSMPSCEPKGGDYILECNTTNINCPIERLKYKGGTQWHHRIVVSKTEVPEVSADWVGHEITLHHTDTTTNEELNESFIIRIVEQRTDNTDHWNIDFDKECSYWNYTDAEVRAYWNGGFTIKGVEYNWLNKKTTIGLIPFSTVSGGGSILNGTGYILNKRLNSKGEEKDQNNSIATGFISVGKDSVVRIKNFSNGDYSRLEFPHNHICLYDTSYNLLTTEQQGYGTNLKNNNIGVLDDTGIYTFTVSDILDSNNIAFMRISTYIDKDNSLISLEDDRDALSVIVTVDEEIANNYYDDRINELKAEALNHEKRLTLLEEGDVDSTVPEYWLEELKAKADNIQQAMEKAGRNKSAFLWYTDAHWVNGSSKVSPLLLNYLYKNTPMNKVNFGGDIIGDNLLETREDMKYLYEWRKAIKDLPNHHSVLGNHDIITSYDVDYEDDNYRYAFMLAPEETSDMVLGAGNYYYIDNSCEKTRYLYLSYISANQDGMVEQAKFIVDAISSTAENWHIVVIAHRWWQYSKVSTPTVGTIPQYETEMLSVFDAYNARTTIDGLNYFTSQDFSSAKGKVEFCIGGHLHIDYDFTTEGGIPVIITASDANQSRVPDSETDFGTLGTATESAVFGIVADYNNNKITIVGVGRGASREIEI